MDYLYYWNKKYYRNVFADVIELSHKIDEKTKMVKSIKKEYIQ